ncbi:uncharacterized protein KRP23_9753 [Phytophthora ramorum]|uniref:uncharacterized protein n=1 Tax=Phytophthora ramorum TaxID=164328 RepID=UPI0030AED0D4|nr:hypothetical protein KRP23_9753 [Phytophthora ramorum]
MLAAVVVSCLLPLLVVGQDQVSYSVSLSTGTLIAIVGGCVVVLLLLICCCCCLRKRRKAKRQRELQAAVAAATVHTPKAGDDSHGIDVPYEQHNTGSTYTGSTARPQRNDTGNSTLQVSFSGVGLVEMTQLAQQCLQIEPENRPTAAEVLYRLHTISKEYPSSYSL